MRIIYGRNPVLEAIKARAPVEKILLAEHLKGGVIEDIKSRARKEGIKIEKAERNRLDQLAGTGDHQGVIAFLPEKDYCSVEEILQMAQKRGEPPFITLLDEVQDPQNLGAIIRSAEGAGVHGVIIPKRRAVGLTEVVAKASAGAIEHIPVARVENLVGALRQLKGEGIWIFGADQNGETLYYQADFSGPVGIVIGSEGRGIRRLIRENCDFLIRIPMYGRIDSLNASVAAALIFYEVRRQRETRSILSIKRKKS